MAPRKKPPKQSSSDESSSVQDRSSLLVSNYEADIKAIEKEIKMSKRRLEKTITNFKLQVVTYKSNLGPEKLRTNLYDMLRSENNGLVLNPIDNYLDYAPKSKALQDETRKTRNETKGRRPNVQDETNSSKVTVSRATTNNDLCRRQRRTIMGETKPSSGENDEEIVGNRRVVDKNIEIVGNKNTKQLVQRSGSSDARRKELEEVKKGDETIQNDETRETSDLGNAEPLRENETKSSCKEAITTDSEQISKASILKHCDNEVITEKDSKHKKSMILDQGSVKETQFIFQACIEENKHFLNSTETSIPTNKPLIETKDGDPTVGSIQKFMSESNIEKWKEKADSVQNARTIVKDQEHDHTKRPNSNDKQLMQTPVQTLYVIPRSTERANIPRSVSAQSNLIDRDSNTSHVKSQNTLPKTTTFGNQNSHRSIINLKTKNTQSNSKGNILRPSKLDNSINKLSNPLIGNTNGTVKDNAGFTNSGNSQKALDNIGITKGKTNTNGTIGKTNASGVFSSRSSTPSKDNQEQRGLFERQSKIPKFHYLSPLPKTTNKFTTSPNRNGRNKLGSNRVTSSKPVSVIKRRPDVAGIQPCLRGNIGTTLKNNVKENVHAFKNSSGIQNKLAMATKSANGIGKETNSKLTGNNGKRLVVPETHTKKIENNSVNEAAAVAEPQTNNEDVPNVLSQNEKLKNAPSDDELRIQETHNEIPTQNTLKEIMTPLNLSINKTTLRERPILKTTQNKDISQLLTITNSPERFVGPEDEPFIDTDGNLNKTESTLNSSREITDKGCDKLSSVSHEISDKLSPVFNVETNDNRETLSKPPLTKMNANQIQTTLTVPNELYTFRDSIVSNKKPIDFIQRNKERIKKMTRKKTSKSKKRVGAFKQFKDSIVIDSRYLMIVNKMLEENRKCTCRRERNKRSGMMGQGKLNQPKESTYAKGPDQHIFVKFNNFQQLHTVLSKMNEQPGANNTSKESSTKSGESSSFSFTERTQYEEPKRPERNEVNFSSPTKESNTDELEPRLVARNRKMSSSDSRYEKRRSLSENRIVKEQLPSETRDGKRRASSECRNRKRQSSNESSCEFDADNDLSYTLTDFTVSTYSNQTNSHDGYPKSYSSSHMKSPSSHESSPSPHKSRSHRDSIKIIQAVPIRMKTRRRTSRTNDSENDVNQKSKVHDRHAGHSSQISRESTGSCSVSQENDVKYKSNTDMSTGRQDVLEKSGSNKSAISQRTKAGDISQTCVSKISQEASNSSVSFLLGKKCPRECRAKTDTLETNRSYDNRGDENSMNKSGILSVNQQIISKHGTEQIRRCASGYQNSDHGSGRIYDKGNETIELDEKSFDANIIKTSSKHIENEGSPRCNVEMKVLNTKTRETNHNVENYNALEAVPGRSETLIEQVGKYFQLDLDGLKNKYKTIFKKSIDDNKVNIGDNIEVLITKERYCKENVKFVELDSTSSSVKPCSINHLANHEHMGNIMSKTIDKFNITPLDKSDKVYNVEDFEHAANYDQPVQMKSKPSQETQKKSTSPIVTKCTASIGMTYSEYGSVINQPEILSNLKIEPIKQEIQDLNCDPSNEETMLGDDSVIFLSEIGPRTNQGPAPNNPRQQEIKLESTSIDNEQNEVNKHCDMEFSLPTLNMNEYNSIEYLETKMTNDINMTRQRPFTLVPLNNLLSSRVKKTLNANQTTVNQPKETFIDDHTLELNDKIDLEIVHLNEITNELGFEHGNRRNKTNESIHMLGNSKASNEPYYTDTRTMNRFENETTSVKMLLDIENESVVHVNRSGDDLCNGSESEIDMKPFGSPSKTEFEKSLDYAFTSTRHNISNVTDSTSKHRQSSQNNAQKTFEKTPKTPKIPAKKSSKTPNISANISTKTPKRVAFGNTFNKTAKGCANTSNKTPKMGVHKATQTPKRAVNIGSVGNSSKVVESSSKTNSDIKNTSSNKSLREVKNSQRTPVPTPRRTVKSSKTTEFVSSTPFRPLQSVGVIKEEPL